MTEKDIERIYNELEQYLILNIKRNLLDDLNSFHLNEEEELGFKWEAWQSAKLRELRRYRRQNKTIINKRLKNIAEKIAQVLRYEQLQGKLDAYKNYKSALTHGYKSSIRVKDSFFKINDRKINSLIKAVNNDFSQANKAVLRRSNDVYREVIAEASMYNQTGVMTEKQAIKKAVSDFEQRGINCIEYSNGAKHKISNYASMAIRTASTRAHLQGEGQLRQKIHSTLILMSKHNTACKLCQPWENKVLIDDVYSGGTKEDGDYPLLSEAMKEGLYHPNCKHGHGTYYPELGKKVSNDIIEEVEQSEKIIQAQHITREENYESILKNGFDLSKSGKGAGTTFGKGVYFTTGRNELDFYKNRLNSSKVINADIDTKGFLQVEFNDYVNRNKMYDTIAEKFTEEQKEEYNKILKQLKINNKEAEKNDDPSKYVFGVEEETTKRILEKYYPGLIIKQNTPLIDIVTGGNQIVVYDLKRIKIRRKKK